MKCLTTDLISIASMMLRWPRWVPVVLNDGGRYPKRFSPRSIPATVRLLAASITQVLPARRASGFLQLLPYGRLVVWTDDECERKRLLPVLLTWCHLLSLKAARYHGQPDKHSTSIRQPWPAIFLATNDEIDWYEDKMSPELDRFGMEHWVEMAIAYLNTF